MKIEVFYFSGCPNHLPTVNRVREVLDREGVSAEMAEVEVRDVASAKRLEFLGSPTVRVNGLDIEHQARSSHAVGFMCRTYIHQGKPAGVPPVEWIQAAVREAKEK
jgi:hypothetical protein